MAFWTMCWRNERGERDFCWKLWRQKREEKSVSSFYCVCAPTISKISQNLRCTGSYKLPFFTSFLLQRCTAKLSRVKDKRYCTIFHFSHNEKSLIRDCQFCFRHFYDLSLSWNLRKGTPNPLRSVDEKKKSWNNTRTGKFRIKMRILFRSGV